MKARSPAMRNTGNTGEKSVPNQSQANRSPKRGTQVQNSTPTASLAPASPVTDPTTKTVRYASTVHVRLTWELPVPVKNPKGCTISYRFTTTPADISFGLFFRDVNGAESTLVRFFPFVLYIDLLLLFVILACL